VREIIWTAAIAAAAAALALVNAGRAQVATPPAEKARQAFQACAACHSDKAGVSRIGPSMAGILGKPAGQAKGFRYSPAMAKAQLRWDRKTLDAFIAKPKAVVPGNRMTYPGVADPAKRKLIIDHIASLR
jgi:cytochrome c2